MITKHQMLKVAVGASVCTLALLVSCRDKNYVAEPSLPPQREEAVLTLRVQPPNEVTLRAKTETTTEPMRTIKLLRFVFYKEIDRIYRVSAIKEQNISTPDQLAKIKLTLPAEDYKLVVIANPSDRLIELTKLEMPLDSVTEPVPMITRDFRGNKNDLSEGISMLNEYGPISVSKAAFNQEASITPITIESALARIIVYGEPELYGATKGKSAPRFIISNLLKRVAPIRPLGLLATGEQESSTQASLARDRYAGSSVWQVWKGKKPENTQEVATLTETQYVRDRFWSTIAPNESAYATRLEEPSLYAKESVLPPTAYLQGITPCVVIEYPYIPKALTLKENEGWVSFQGQHYTETEFRGFIAKGQYPNHKLKAAAQKIDLEAEAFKAGFEREGIKFYYEAKNYYVVYIRHFDQPTSSKHGKFGVVRGNEYRIKILNITAAGSPTWPLLEGNLSDIVETATAQQGISTSEITSRTQEAEL